MQASLRLVSRPCCAATARRAFSLSLPASVPRPPPPPPNYLSQLSGSYGPSGSSLAGDSPSLGPFPLPSGGTREENVRAAERSWRQLKRTEKLGRAWVQLTSLLVVLGGGAITVAVIYSTGTELASPSSPTRVFEDCTERVKASEELRTLLLEPYTFHGANSSHRLRRNRRISSHLSKDAAGNDILQIQFWVEGAAPPDDTDRSWWDTIKSYVGPAIWEDSSKPGSFVPRPSSASAHADAVSKAPEPEPVRSWSQWVADGLVSMVGGLVPRTKTGSESSGGSASLFRKARKPALGEYTTGEAVAELKKDPTSNTFVYQQLYVDVPDSTSPHRYRVYISTQTVGEPATGWDRLRFWQRKQVAP